MALQPKEFYCKYQGFEFKSGTEDGAGRTIDWQVVTDSLQGINSALTEVTSKYVMELVMKFVVKM